MHSQPTVLVIESASDVQQGGCVHQQLAFVQSCRTTAADCLTQLHAHRTRRCRMRLPLERIWTCALQTSASTTIGTMASDLNTQCCRIHGACCALIQERAWQLRPCWFDPHLDLHGCFVSAGPDRLSACYFSAVGGDVNADNRVIYPSNINLYR